MFRDILSSRAILAGLAFFVLMVAGSLLYSWHVQRTTEAELEVTNPAVQALEHRNKSRTAQEVEVLTENENPDFVGTPDENTNTPMSNETGDLDLLDAFLPDGSVSEKKQVPEDVLVSPFGFGPYPEVPHDYPHKNFNWEAHLNDSNPASELMARVRIKLWREQQIYASGASFMHGKIYPVIRGIVYPRYKEWNGRRYMYAAIVHPDDIPSYVKASSTELPSNSKDDQPLSPVIQYIQESIRSGTLKAIDFEDAGIDPYQFLNL